MCIAIIMPKGAQRPDRFLLQQCHSRNPDGAGLAYTVAGSDKVYYRKGFMDFNAFWDAYSRECFGNEVGTVVVHFRLASVGGLSPEFTHPFPVSPVFSDLYSLRGETTDPVLFHNGTVHHMGIPGGMSDSQELARRLAQGKEISPEDLGYSRVVVLHGNGTYNLAGQWVTQGDPAHPDSPGCLYSNDGYKLPVETPVYRLMRWLRGGRRGVAAALKANHANDREYADSVVSCVGGKLMPMHQLLRKAGASAGYYVDPDRRVYLMIARKGTAGSSKEYDQAYLVGKLTLYRTVVPVPDPKRPRAPRHQARPAGAV